MVRDKGCGLRPESASWSAVSQLWGPGESLHCHHALQGGRGVCRHSATSVSSSHFLLVLAWGPAQSEPQKVFPEWASE